MLVSIFKIGGARVSLVCYQNAITNYKKRYEAHIGNHGIIFGETRPTKRQIRESIAKIF